MYNKSVSYYNNEIFNTTNNKIIQSSCSTATSALNGFDILKVYGDH